ncbi:polysaccharide deacetylase family protein [uncultured Microscilla sp.]|uniref:polysaccharide deacetylase family protein n=1 Tax=uncultured Microscilla sp. TaxID=432653 RepID=UPI002635C275|nr:polysaccharide deacetylase family protein [uncultured Microscilla sp.]
MKTAKRRLLITMIVGLNLFNAMVIYKLWWSELQQVGNTKKKKLAQPTKVKSHLATDTAICAQVFMPIKGHSYKLSTVAMQKLQDYRTQQRKLAMRYPGLVFFNGDTARKEVALTFDDGPDGQVTLQVLEVLAKYKVKGSFFFVGNYVQKYPQIARQVYKQGHLILNHSHTHQSYINKSKQWIKQDLLAAENAIAQAIGKRPAMFRPPYGDIDSVMIEEVHANKYKNIIWSYDTLDWTGIVKDSIAQGVKSGIRAGEIILMHSRQGTMPTAQALPDIIMYLQDVGYTIVSLDKMLNLKAYK